MYLIIFIKIYNIYFIVKLLFIFTYPLVNFSEQISVRAGKHVNKK